jgi:hypothetical protein
MSKKETCDILLNIVELLNIIRPSLLFYFPIEKRTELILNEIRKRL